MPRATFGQGWFGSVNSGMIGGLLMMIIAAVWFGVGYWGGRIFFHPPIQFIIGLFSLLEGLFSRE